MNKLFIISVIIFGLYLLFSKQYEGFHGHHEHEFGPGQHAGIPMTADCGKPACKEQCKGGEWRLFKSPAYYGQGGVGYHYGEPMYWRHTNA